MAHHVFVSYSRADKDTVDAICEALEESGLSCWYAPRDVPIGADWDTSIIEALTASRVLILVWSKQSDQSRHVKREVALALDEMEVTVIPFRIESTEPSKLRYYLGGIQWLDASIPPLEANLERLVEQVKVAIPVTGQLLISPEEFLQRSQTAVSENIPEREPKRDVTGKESKRLEEQTRSGDEGRWLREAEAIQEAEAAALEKAEAEAFRHSEAKARLRAEIESLRRTNTGNLSAAEVETLRRAREKALKQLETEAVQHAETKARLLAEVESLREAAQGSLKRAGVGHKSG
ncbi:MAG TPA: toll/interleukin-1 receptor domain-containing protein [Pyrinomonadaceae bacterium]|jgi:hypothetical protein